MRQNKNQSIGERSSPSQKMTRKSSHSQSPEHIIPKAAQRKKKALYKEYTQSRVLLEKPIYATPTAANSMPLASEN